MAEPIVITVTATTAQAGDDLKKFAANTNKELGTIQNSAAAAGQHIAGMAYYFRSGIDSIRMAAMGGGARAGFYAMDEGVRGLLASGLKLSTLVPVIGGVAAAAGVGALAWKYYFNLQDEADEKSKKLAKSLGEIPGILERIHALTKAGLVSPAAENEFADYLNGKIKLYKDESGALTRVAEEQGELEARMVFNPASGTYEQMGTERRTIKRPEATQEEFNAWVQKQQPEQFEEQSLAKNELTAAAQKAHEQSLIGIEKEKQAVIDRYQTEFNKIDLLIEKEGKLATPGELQKAKQVKLDLATGLNNELAAIDQKAADDQVKCAEDANKQIEEAAKLTSEHIKQLKKEELDAVVLQQQAQRDALMQEKFNVVSNPFMTGDQKSADLEIILQKQIAIARTEQERIGYERELKQLQTAQTFTGSFGAMLTQLQDQAAINFQTLAATFQNVFNSAIASISHGIEGLVEGTMTWNQALKEIRTSILDSIVQAIVQMGVRWVMTQALMAMGGQSIIDAAAASTVVPAAAATAAWATPATLATIATMGAAALAAPSEIFASEAATMAGSIAHFAAGGRIAGGQIGLVGEEGPEIFVPDGPGTIIPAGPTAAMMGGKSMGGGIGGGVSVKTILVANIKQAVLEAMASPAGEKIHIAHARKNKISTGVQT